MIDRLPKLGYLAAYAKQAIRDKLIEHKAYIRAPWRRHAGGAGVEMVARRPHAKERGRIGDDERLPEAYLLFFTRQCGGKGCHEREKAKANPWSFRFRSNFWFTALLCRFRQNAGV